MIPSNSFAAVYAIAADCAHRQVLGPNVAIDMEAIDETNTRRRADDNFARNREWETILDRLAELRETAAIPRSGS